MGLKIESINFLDIEKQLESLDDPDTMQQVHNTYAKFLDPYVPMDEGVLAHDVTVTPEYVQYNSPYAHYMYTGIVYGPNIPIMSDGEIVGYWSPPNQANTQRERVLTIQKKNIRLLLIIGIKPLWTAKEMYSRVMLKRYCRIN